MKLSLRRPAQRFGVGLSPNLDEMRPEEHLGMRMRNVEDHLVAANTGILTKPHQVLGSSGGNRLVLVRALGTQVLFQHGAMHELPARGCCLLLQGVDMRRCRRHVQGAIWMLSSSCPGRPFPGCCPEGVNRQVLSNTCCEGAV